MSTTSPILSVVLFEQPWDNHFRRPADLTMKERTFAVAEDYLERI